MRLLTLTIFTFISITFSSFGQVVRVDKHYNLDTLTLDTIKLFDSKRNVAYCDYEVTWFFRSPCISKSYSYKYSGKKLSKQDKLIFNTIPYYFKCYDKKGRLYMEAAKAPGGRLVRDIRYYRENGTLDRIEHYNAYSYMVNDTIEYLINDGPGPDGVWEYYDDNEQLEKSEEYTVKLNPNGQPIRIRITTTYNSDRSIKDTNETFLF